jgi:hypothetical protein
MKVYAERALEAADSAPQIIRDKAMLDNEDVDGNQMPAKQPRPQRNPKNFPNMALVQNEEPDTMDPARWSVTPTIQSGGNFERSCFYQGPDHLEYLLSKDPDKGGRPFIKTDGTINPNARAEIEAEMVRRVKE